MFVQPIEMEKQGNPRSAMAMKVLSENDSLLSFQDFVTETKVDHLSSSIALGFDDVLGLELLGLDHLNDLFAVIAKFDDAFLVEEWDLQKGLSDLIMDGLCYKGVKDKNVIMLFESPSSFSFLDASFVNQNNYKFNDWPPPKSALTKTVLGPCRYASMNGMSLPVYLKDGNPPTGLEEHWAQAIPDHQRPFFVSEIRETDIVYAYLPAEQLRQHLNDPDGKSIFFHDVSRAAAIGDACLVFILYPLT